MSKKEHTEFAKRLYIVDNMSIRDISAKLCVSERTLQNWKTAGGWEAEKNRIAVAKGMTHEAVYAELGLLLTSMRQDREAGKEIDMDKYRQLESLSKIMKNTFDYEKNAPKKTEAKRTPADIAKEINKILLGEN